MNRILLSFLLLILASCSNSNEEDAGGTYLLFSPESISFDYLGGEKQIIVDTNTQWEIKSSLADWITIGEVTDKKITIGVKRNDSDMQRIKTVEFLTKDKKVYTLSIKQSAKGKLYFISTEPLYIDASENEYEVNIESNINYQMSILGNDENWITASYGNNNTLIGNISSGNKESNKIHINVKENKLTEARNANLVVYNSIYQLSDTLQIIQDGIKEATDGRKYEDGECILLQEGILGHINLVIMGDAFTSEDLYQDGKYEQCIRKAMDYYFTIEPFSSYRDYFDIYMVVVESPTDYIGSKENLNLSTQRNKFSIAYGNGTEIVCNADLVLEYARKTKKNIQDTPEHVIVVLNDDKYAGTTYLFDAGNSIALCPMSSEPSPNDFEGLIHHEACGHGFGFLCDEYVYYQSQLPKESKDRIQEWQQLGFQMNVDFTNDPSAVLWKDFIGLNQYNEVGLFEGGYMYQYGIWRSEENSCMNNNIPYFNVQSRWCIVKRIMQLADIPFTHNDFIIHDKNTNYTTTRTTKFISCRPLGSPVWIKTTSNK